MVNMEQKQERPSGETPLNERPFRSVPSVEAYELGAEGKERKEPKKAKRESLKGKRDWLLAIRMELVQWKTTQSREIQTESLAQLRTLFTNNPFDPNHKYKGKVYYSETALADLANIRALENDKDALGNHTDALKGWFTARLTEFLNWFALAQDERVKQIVAEKGIPEGKVVLPKNDEMPADARNIQDFFKPLAEDISERVAAESEPADKRIQDIRENIEKIAPAPKVEQPPASAPTSAEEVTKAEKVLNHYRAALILAGQQRAVAKESGGFFSKFFNKGKSAGEVITDSKFTGALAEYKKALDGYARATGRDAGECASEDIKNYLEKKIKDVRLLNKIREEFSK